MYHTSVSTVVIWKGGDEVIVARARLACWWSGQIDEGQRQGMEGCCLLVTEVQQLLLAQAVQTPQSPNMAPCPTDTASASATASAALPQLPTRTHASDDHRCASIINPPQRPLILRVVETNQSGSRPIKPPRTAVSSCHSPALAAHMHQHTPCVSESVRAASAIPITPHTQSLQEHCRGTTGPCATVCTSACRHTRAAAPTSSSGSPPTVDLRRMR